MATPEQTAKLAELNSGRGKYYVVNPGTIFKNVATGANAFTAQEPSVVQDWMYQLDSQGGYGSQGLAWDGTRGQAYDTEAEARAAWQPIMDAYSAQGTHSAVGNVADPGPVSQSVTQVKDANGNWVTTQSINAPKNPVGQVLGYGNEPLVTPQAQSSSQSVPSPAPVPSQTGGQQLNQQQVQQQAQGVPQQQQQQPQQQQQMGYNMPGQQQAQPQSQMQGQPQQQPQQQVVSAPTVNLQPGQTGADVQQLQNWLGSQGYLTPQQIASGPGTFGPQTTAALAKWQADHGVDVGANAGYYGPKTMAAIQSSKPTPGIGSGLGNVNLPSGTGSLSQGLNTAKDLANNIQSTLQGLTDKGYGNVDISQIPETTDISRLPNITEGLAQHGVDSNIPEFAKQANIDPLTFVSDIYTKLYQSSGLADIKEQYKTFTDKIETLTNQKNDEKGVVNDNPWYSQDIKDARNKKIEDKYQLKIDSATASAKLMQGFYDQGQQTIQTLASQAVSIYNNQVDAQQAEYLQTMKIAADRQDALLQLKNGGGDYKNVKEVNGGLFDLAQNKWIVQPKSDGTGAGGVGNTNGISAITGKPLTDTERSAQGYANRLTTSNQTIDSLGANFTDLKSYGQAALPNILQAPEYQQYVQAQRDFINATLRRESGAAISDSEFNNGRQQYFPQPGDKPDVIAQKAQNRKNTIASLQLAGGQITSIPQGGSGSNTSGGVPKGSLSDSAFVEKSLSSQSIKYADVLAKTPAGTIAVLDNASGQVGYIPASNFNSSKYTKL